MKADLLTRSAVSARRTGSRTQAAKARAHWQDALQACASGFTLIEFLIAIAVLMTITAIAVPNFLSAMERAKVARAVGDVRTIGNAALSYNAIYQQYPDNLAQIGYDLNLDPWGRPYQYLNLTDAATKNSMRTDRFAVPLNTYFDLYSLGKDGASALPLTASTSQDDVVWANDGGFVGLASDY